MNDHSKKNQHAGIQTYQKTDVLTANRETILLMLYAGAIRFLRRAIEAAKTGSRSQKCESLTRAQRIVSELRSTLNFDAGGDLVLRLESLYSFISRRLIDGVTDSDTRGLEEALNLLVDLNGAWEQAIAQLRGTERQPKE